MSSLVEKAAELAPEKIEFVVKTAEVIKSGPFAVETAESLENIIKEASFMNNFGNAAAGVGGVVASGIAYSLANDLYDATRRGLTKTRNYKAMMQENPDLAELPAHDVQKAFNALHRFNPEFSGDPTVAGAFVRREASLGEFDTKMLTDMVSARQSLTNLKKLPMPNQVPWQSAQDRQMAQLALQEMQGRTSPEAVQMAKDKMKSEIDRNRQQVINAPYQRQQFLSATQANNARALDAFHGRYRTGESPGRMNKRQNKHRP